MQQALEKLDTAMAKMEGKFCFELFNMSHVMRKGIICIVWFEIIRTRMRSYPVSICSCRTICPYCVWEQQWLWGKLANVQADLSRRYWPFVKNLYHMCRLIRM